jgi:HEAT repeat protein
MTRVVKLVAVPVLTLLIGGVAGFAIGQRQGINMITTMAFAATNGELSLHVDAASSLRTGDTERALMLLDTLIDSATVTLRDSAVRTGEAPRALRDAKLYRTAVQAAGPTATAVADALRDVPAPSATEPLPPGLRKLTGK